MTNTKVKVVKEIDAIITNNPNGDLGDNYIAFVVLECERCHWQFSGVSQKHESINKLNYCPMCGSEISGVVGDANDL